MHCINPTIYLNANLQITVEDSTIRTASFHKAAANQKAQSTVNFHQTNAIKYIRLKNVVFEDIQEILFEQKSLGDDILLPQLDADNVICANSCLCNVRRANSTTTYQTKNCPSPSSSNPLFHTTLQHSLFAFALFMFLDLIWKCINFELGL